MNVSKTFSVYIFVSWVSANELFWGLRHNRHKTEVLFPNTPVFWEQTCIYIKSIGSGSIRLSRSNVVTPGPPDQVSRGICYASPCRGLDTAGCICCFAHKRSENAVLFLLMLICSVLGPRFTARSAFPDTILPFVAVKVPLSHRVSI